jgi:iron complex transport system substrate-binding protein
LIEGRTVARRVFCETLGVELNLPERCRRIISFSPAVTESLFSMGLGDAVVGVSAFCVRPPAAREKPILGSYSSANIDRIRSLSPDLIFTTTGYQREFAEKLSQEFPLYAIPLPPTLSALLASCVEPGLVAGYYGEARKLERVLLNCLRDMRIGPDAPRSRVYIEVDLGGPVTFGAHSYITDTLELVGLRNIFADAPSEWLSPDMERVKEEEPDLIIYEPKMFRPIDKAALLERLRRRGWGDLRAVREFHVYVTPGPYDFLAHHGPSFITHAIPWLQGLTMLRE